jgi:hypothetical protein
VVALSVGHWKVTIGAEPEWRGLKTVIMATLSAASLFIYLVLETGYTV